jgi:hypothetical protein
MPIPTENCISVEDKENESWYNELAVKTKEMKATTSLPIIHVNKIIFCHKWFGVA